MHTDGERITKLFRRLRQLSILGAAAAALLIQTATVAGEGVAAGSDGARAVEAGRRSDPAVAQPARPAALKRRMDEMRERRRGRRRQQEERLRHLTPDERRRRIEPHPIPRRPRQLDDALERAEELRRRLGAPKVVVRQ